mmetsp:Transcript_27116/g.88950  ORF Transcript_27116/g.88950 Transcript_27116/m.88950 type:complete len:378 (-) Transcript_27116:1832-2965(-)
MGAEGSPAPPGEGNDDKPDRKAPHPVPPGMEDADCPVMDPVVQPMGKVGMDKGKVEEATATYEQFHAKTDDESYASRRRNYEELVNTYYDLVTSFYEYGWGQSFHFAHRLRRERFAESIRRHEYYIGLKLGVGEGDKVIDVGCGIGGPLRAINAFTGASITGLNNNAYQIKRGQIVNHRTKRGKMCDFLKGDFMEMPVDDKTFDAGYAIEATCHAPDAAACYREIYRVLKPGAVFAGYEWCLTNKFTKGNKRHQRIKAEIELGNGIPDMRTIFQFTEALRAAGFEVLETEDRAETSEEPWWGPLNPSRLSLMGFRTTAVGRFCTRRLVAFLELTGLAPAGSSRVSAFLEKGGDALVEGGKEGLFTPMFFFKIRKPAA